MSEETFNFKKDRFQKIIDKDCIVIDVGAHIGTFSKLFANSMANSPFGVLESFVESANTVLISSR